MNAHDREIYLWMALASSVGTFSILMFFGLGFGLNSNSDGAVLYWAWVLLQVVLGGISIRGLNQCYREEPIYWKGRWHFSLSDLISIVIFFGCSLLFVRILTPRKDFSTIHVCAAGVLGLGYSVALLISIREEKYKAGLQTWVRAFELLIFSITTILIGTALQGCLVFIPILIWLVFNFHVPI